MLLTCWTTTARLSCNEGVAKIHVTSPKGLHGWKHRFAANRTLSSGFAVTASTHPLGFGSIGLHGVPIGSIALQSCSLLVDWQAEGKQRCRPRLPTGLARRPRPFCPILQSYGSNSANLWVK